MDAEYHVKRYDRLRTQRASWESHWEEVAEYCLPRQRGMLGDIERGSKLQENVYDGTAQLALERFASALEGLLTPRSQRWHHLRANVEGLNETKEARDWFAAAEDILFKSRYSPRTNYASQQHEVYMSLGAFGTGALFIDEKPGGGLRYRAMHLGDLFCAENMDGRIDTVYRKAKMTARQIVQRTDPQRNINPWRDIPEKVYQKAEKNPEEEIEVLHCVYPREERKAGRIDRTNLPYASLWIILEGKQIVDEGGFHELPYAVSRYVTAPREVYGRSPAMQALPDISTLNEMSRTMMRAGHKAVDPPILAWDDGILDEFDLRPGALNYGGIDSQGRQMIVPFQSGMNLPFGLELEDQRRQAINDTFLVTLFQILADSGPQMTATEVLERAQEKGTLLTPTVGRQQSEMLGPMIEREVGILARAGIMPPLPEVLQGGEYEIEYDSPLSQAQKAGEGVGLLRFWEAMLPVAQFKPEILDNVDGDEFARKLAEIHGVASILFGRDEVQQARMARQQQEAIQQMVEGAGPVTQGFKNMADAAKSTAQARSA